MSVIKFDRDFSTLFNWDTDDNPTTEQDYQNAVKNWTETEMNIVDTLLWQPTTEYSTGNIVKTPSLPSQYVLRCAEAGTSGSTEPSYSGASVGDTVTDGTVEWVIVSLATGNAADVDAGNIGVNAEVDNSEAWASAIGGGAVAEDDGRLVKGGTVYAVTNALETDIATNTEAIEDNAEAIATNTENIAQNTTDIDINDKRISNIEKLLQGNLYDYQTDNNSAYTKTVPNGAMPYASLDSIGGKTLVWNQLVDPSRLVSRGTVSSVGLTQTTDGNGAIIINGTSTQATNIYISNTLPLTGGHKYIIYCDKYSADWYFRIGSSDLDTSNGAKIASPLSSGNVLVYFNFASGVTFDNLSIRVQYTDLTLLYGADNEPSTVAEFESMFPASYYSYNAGTLLSAGVTSVISKKADTTEIATYPIPAEVQALEGYGWSAGNVYNYIDFERKVFVKNVGSVVLDGTQTIQLTNWRPKTNSVGWLYSYNLTNNKISSTYVAPNVLTDKIPTTTYNGIYNNDISCITAYTSTAYGLCVRVADTSLTTSSAINTYLSANPITVYYELETPIETDISAYLTDDNLISVEAGGTLTFPNQHGDDYRIDVPSQETYMVDLQGAI